ncbi:MAG: hypothetical protein AAGI71_13150 [Bacteroidota bacterium]
MRLSLNSKYRLHVVEADAAVVLLGETQSHVLQGEVVMHLLPRLDGTQPLHTLLRELPHRMRADDAIHLVASLLTDQLIQPC